MSVLYHVDSKGCKSKNNHMELALIVSFVGLSVVCIIFIIVFLIVLKRYNRDLSIFKYWDPAAKQHIDVLKAQKKKQRQERNYSVTVSSRDSPKSSDSSK